MLSQIDWTLFSKQWVFHVVVQDIGGTVRTGYFESSSGVQGEFLTVVDSETGDLVWEAPWPAVKPRVLMTVGHLQCPDQPASLVVLDGTYARDGYVVPTAVNRRTSEVDWRVEQTRPAGHNLDIGDIDGDGVQEVICGGACYNGDGTVRREAEPFGHTDISKPAKIDPGREGEQADSQTKREWRDRGSTQR